MNSATLYGIKDGKTTLQISARRLIACVKLKNPIPRMRFVNYEKVKRREGKRKSFVPQKLSESTPVYAANIGYEYETTYVENHRKKKKERRLIYLSMLV